MEASSTPDVTFNIGTKPSADDSMLSGDARVKGRIDQHKAQATEKYDATGYRAGTTQTKRSEKKQQVLKAARAAASAPVSSPISGTNKRKATERLENYVGAEMKSIEQQDGTSYVVTVANTRAERDYKASTQNIDKLLSECCTASKQNVLYLQMVLLFAQTKENFDSYNPGVDAYLQTNINSVVNAHFDPKKKDNVLHLCTAFLALCMAARKIVGVKNATKLFDFFKLDVEYYSEQNLDRKVVTTATKQPPYYYLVSDLAARLELDARTNFTCYTTPERTIHGIATFMAKAEITSDNTAELQEMLNILNTTSRYKAQAAKTADASAFRNVNISNILLRLRFH